MAKGEALKQFKDEQKAVTAEKIKQTIIEIRKNKDLKLSVSNVAKLSGISRANIYAHYKDLIDDFTKVDLNKEPNQEKIIFDKNIIEENKLLKKQVRELQEDKKQLMDKIIALKIVKQGLNGSSR